MQNKFISSKQNLFGFISKTYRTSTLMSFKEGRTVVVDMPKPKNYSKTEHAVLDFLEQNMWTQDVRAYSELWMKTRKSVQAVYHLLWSHFHELL